MTKEVFKDDLFLFHYDALTFDDVLIAPNHSEILPTEVGTELFLTPTIRLNIPIISAAMDTVTESAMAIKMADLGGMGIIHRNQSIERQAKEVEKVKKFESFIIKDPVTISPTATLKEATYIMSSLKISGLPVVEGKRLVGILTERDIAFEDNFTKKVSENMTPASKLVTAKWPVTNEQAKERMKEKKVEKLPLVDDSFNLCGLVTMKDIRKKTTNPNASKDSEGRLICGAAIGTDASSFERAEELIKKYADVITIDTAHGDSKRVIDIVKNIKKKYPNVAVVAGNVATYDGTKNLIQAGADIIKVGIGPGSICTTRIIAGVGVPQLSAVVECAKATKGTNVKIIADGGIRHSGDINKALVAGANAIMIGSLFAGTDESPSELVSYQGKPYKMYRGMGSLGSLEKGCRDRYGQTQETPKDKLVPEGVEGMVPYKGKLENIIFQLVGGIRAGMGYVGAKTLDEMSKRGKFIRITHHGMEESHVHDVVMTHEPPNYSLPTKERQ